MNTVVIFIHFTVIFTFTHGYSLVCLHNACFYNHGHWECEHQENQVVECGQEGVCAEFSQPGKFQPSDILDRRRCLKKSTIADHDVRNRLAHHQDFCKIWGKNEYKQRMCYCATELCNHKLRLPEIFTVKKQYDNKTHFRQEHHH